MYYKTWEEWQKVCPIVDGIWDKERLYGYLVAMCHEFRKPIETFLGNIKMQLLRKKKDLLLKAQANEINWKRPFPHDEHLDWFID